MKLRRAERAPGGSPSRPRVTLPGVLLALLGLAAVGLLLAPAVERRGTRRQVPDGREEVVFWHFWGGADREVVDQVVARFNRSQQRYHVRALAMPGNNLDLKLFLAVTGGEPPDLINQDDPIVADWAHRGALLPLDAMATAEELRQLDTFLVPAARRLGSYRGRYYALCNGLDIRALYYNQTLLDQFGLQPPRTLADLDRIAAVTTSRDASGRITRFGYLPDPRRLWAWGIVFGGAFYDPATGRVTADDPRVVAALEWMTGYRDRFGAKAVAAFRQGDQSLPGKTFPLLAGRYAVVMDGQWRVRDIAAARQRQLRRGEPLQRYGVCPLPPPPQGRAQAGWVNGNFFLVPRGAANPRGAWEFMKFWSGFAGHAPEAARTCVAGGWIPVSRNVTKQPVYQEFLRRQPLMRTFVELSQSDNQVPTPLIPGAPLLQREIHAAAAAAMFTDEAPPPRKLLSETTERVQRHLDDLQRQKTGNGESAARQMAAKLPRRKGGKEPMP